MVFRNTDIDEALKVILLEEENQLLALRVKSMAISKTVNSVSSGSNYGLRKKKEQRSVKRVSGQDSNEKPNLSEKDKALRKLLLSKCKNKNFRNGDFVVDPSDIPDEIKQSKFWLGNKHFISDKAEYNTLMKEARKEYSQQSNSNNEKQEKPRRSNPKNKKKADNKKRNSNIPTKPEYQNTINRIRQISDTNSTDLIIDVQVSKNSKAIGPKVQTLVDTGSKSTIMAKKWYDLHGSDEKVAEDSVTYVGANGTRIKNYGKLIGLDLVIGNTLIPNVDVTILDIENWFILGSDILNKIEQNCSWLTTTKYHHLKCPLFGKPADKKTNKCSEKCVFGRKVIVINPLDREKSDIIECYEDKKDTLNDLVSENVISKLQVISIDENANPFELVLQEDVDLIGKTESILRCAIKDGKQCKRRKIPCPEEYLFDLSTKLEGIETEAFYVTNHCPFHLPKDSNNSDYYFNARIFCKESCSLKKDTVIGTLTKISKAKGAKMQEKDKRILTEFYETMYSKLPDKLEFAAPNEEPEFEIKCDDSKDPGEKYDLENVINRVKPVDEICHVSEDGKKHQISICTGFENDLKVEFLDFCQSISRLFFADEGYYLPHIKGYKARLNIRESETLQNQKPIPLPDSQIQILHKIVGDMERRGIFMRITSPYSCKVLLIPKKPDPANPDKPRFRLVQCLNECSAKSTILNYELCNPREIINTIPESHKVFCSLDLHNSYWQVLLDERDRAYTAWRMPYSPKNVSKIGKQYGMCRLAQGHLNSAYSLNEAFLVSFKDIAEQCQVRWYVDDIIISEETPEKLLSNLKIFLQRLFDRDFTLSGHKCTFCHPSVSFAGYTVSQSKVTIMDKHKSNIQDLTTPSNTKQAQSLFGMINFIRGYIPNFSSITKPITDTFNTDNNGQPFLWGPAQEEALSEIKKMVNEDLSLNTIVYKDPNRPIKIYTDASKT